MALKSYLITDASKTAMDVVKAKSKSLVGRRLEASVSGDSRTVYAVASDVVRRNDFSVKARVYICKFLIPSMAIVNTMLHDGDKAKYEREYMRQLSRPESCFCINEMIYQCIKNNAVLVLVCSRDEQEFGYIDILSEFIEMNYGIKPVGAKKFIAGKHSKSRYNDDQLLRVVEQRREMLYLKLKDLRIDPIQIMSHMIDRKDLKHLPDDLKKKIRKSLEDEY